MADDFLVPAETGPTTGIPMIGGAVSTGVETNVVITFPFFPTRDSCFAVDC